MGLFYRITDRIVRKYHNMRSKAQIESFAEHGVDVRVGYGCDFIPSHIHIGNHVSIGSHASFLASKAHIYIGNYVIFGPSVTIRGGDHRIDLIGKHISEIGGGEKLPENDKDVRIEDGVWIGCNVTILKGVTIGRGAVVGAGSLVTKDVPPYGIAVGNPAKVVKIRFTEEQIQEHEMILKNRGLL